MEFYGTDNEHFIIEEGLMNKSGSASIQNLQINKIKLAKNSRLDIGDGEIAGLMQSIKEVGLLQPIGVAKSAAGYEICYGNRRFLAASKLGWKRIPAVVHESKKATELDVKNLAENVQRRNISLAEVGRYVELLKREQMTNKEIAVRLGTTESYVKSALEAYQEVPKSFRSDLEISIANNKKTPGKISIKTARAILNVKKSYNLKEDEVKELFSAAKTDDRFSVENVPKYATALKRGSKDFIGAVKSLKHVRFTFLMTEDDYEQIEKKYVDDGPFRSVNALLVAVLRGEKAVKINVIK